MRLAGELHVQRMRHLDGIDTDRLLADQRLALAGLRRQHSGKPVDVHGVERRVDRAHEIMPQVGDDTAKRVGDPRSRRHQNLGNAELAGQRRGMERPRPAKGEQSEVARIQTKRDGDHAGRAGHAGRGHAQHRRRRRFGIDAERVTEPCLEDGADIVDIDRPRDRLQLAGVKTAKNHVGVGDRRQIAATPVADGPRVGAGALRPDLEEAGFVDPRDRPAAGADGADIDHRNVDRHRIFDLDLVRHRRLAVADQRHVCRGAAHVIADEVRPVGAAPGIGGGNHAGGRPRHNGLRRLANHPVRRDGAAIAVHHQKLAAIAAIGKLVGEPLHIPLQKRLHRGVHRRRHPALEFTAFREQPVPHRDVAVRPDVGEDLGGPDLVRRVRIGVKEMDHHRFRPARQKLFAGGAHRRLVERGHDAAGVIHSFRHLEPKVARNDRVEMALHPVGLRPGATAELQNIAEAGRGDQAGPAELAFQNRVRRRCGAVDDKGDPRQFAFGLGDGIHHPESLIVQRAGDLCESHRAARLIEPDKVGEGAADINADQVAIVPLLAAGHVRRLPKPAGMTTAGEPVFGSHSLVCE